jgi:hypothetical protein
MPVLASKRVTLNLSYIIATRTRFCKSVSPCGARLNPISSHVIIGFKVEKKIGNFRRAIYQDPYLGLPPFSYDRKHLIIAYLINSAESAPQYCRAPCSRSSAPIGWRFLHDNLLPIRSSQLKLASKKTFCVAAERAHNLHTTVPNFTRFELPADEETRLLLTHQNT